MRGDLESLGHCPKCGRFCGNIKGTIKGGIDGYLEKVSGVCKTHGEVDLSGEPWGWDDFFVEPAPQE